MGNEEPIGRISPLQLHVKSFKKVDLNDNGKIEKDEMTSCPIDLKAKYNWDAGWDKCRWLAENPSIWNLSAKVDPGQGKIEADDNGYLYTA